jgi:hypothetical protein
MKSFSTLTTKEKNFEVLRWICVLPASMLAGYLGWAAAGALARIAFGGIGFEGTGRWVRHLVANLLSEPARVFVGAKTAPRSRQTTAIVLAVLNVALAILIHREDYLPIVAQAIGLAVGIVIVHYSELPRQSTPEDNITDASPSA